MIKGICAIASLVFLGIWLYSVSPEGKAEKLHPKFFEAVSLSDTAEIYNQMPIKMFDYIFVELTDITNRKVTTPTEKEVVIEYLENQSFYNQMLIENE